MQEIYQILEKNNFRFVTDSRLVSSGDIFFAIKGENFDGNDFLEDVFRAGASWIVCNNASFSDSHENAFYVEDTVQVLGELASFHRSKFDIPVIALTGSNGKTTTKEMLRKVLSQKFEIVATEGNLNNHLGVPYTLLSIKKSTQMVIVEMGANHVGEIRYLCEIAKPTHGLITNIGLAHVGKFGGLSGVQKAKGELFDFLKLHNGIVFADCGDEIIMQMLRDRQMKTNCYVETAPVSQKLFGEYNLQNARCGATVGKFFGVPDDVIEKTLKDFTPAQHRSNILQTKNGNIIIADMYNANPTSMEKALVSFKNFQKDAINKIVIVGDMLELGEYSRKEHEKIVSLIKELEFPFVVFIGPEFESCHNIFGHVFHDISQAISHLKAENITNSICFLKGSNGIGLKKILDQEIL